MFDSCSFDYDGGDQGATQRLLYFGSMELILSNLTPRSAVSLIFVIHGVFVATWACYIPAIKERLYLSDSTLGLTLFTMGMGCFLSLFFTPGLIHRYGSRSLTILSTVSLCITIPVSILASSLSLLVVLLIINGMLVGIMDMGMNTQAGEIEHELGKPIMSSMHALFSVGSLAAACLGSVLHSIKLPPTLHLIPVVALSALVISFVWDLLIPARLEHEHQIAVIKLPERRYWGLGGLCFIAFMSEGAMIDWIPLFLEKEQGALEGLSLMGIAAFQLGMTGGRFSGDLLRGRLGMGKLFWRSGVLSTVGLALTLCQGHSVVSLVGLVLVGLGLSNTVPLLFSAASSAAGPGKAGAGISAVAGVGYSGLLLGPPAIGFLSDLFGLRGALCVLLVLVSLLWFRAREVGDG